MNQFAHTTPSPHSRRTFALVVGAVTSVFVASAPAYAASESLTQAPPSAWLWVGVTVLAGFLTCRRWPWAALLVLPLSLLPPVLALVEHSTPSALASRIPGHGNPQFLVLALCAIAAADLLGLHDGGFRLSSFPPWDATKPLPPHVPPRE